MENEPLTIQFILSNIQRYYKQPPTGVLTPLDKSLNL